MPTRKRVRAATATMAATQTRAAVTPANSMEDAVPMDATDAAASVFGPVSVPEIPRKPAMQQPAADPRAPVAIDESAAFARLLNTHLPNQQGNPLASPPPPSLGNDPVALSARSILVPPPLLPHSFPQANTAVVPPLPLPQSFPANVPTLGLAPLFGTDQGNFTLPYALPHAQGVSNMGAGASVTPIQSHHQQQPLPLLPLPRLALGGSQNLGHVAAAAATDTQLSHAIQEITPMSMIPQQQQQQPRLCQEESLLSVLNTPLDMQHAPVDVSAVVAPTDTAEDHLRLLAGIPTTTTPMETIEKISPLTTDLVKETYDSTDHDALFRTDDMIPLVAFPGFPSKQQSETSLDFKAIQDRLPLQLNLSWLESLGASGSNAPSAAAITAITTTTTTNIAAAPSIPRSNALGGRTNGRTNSMSEMLVNASNIQQFTSNPSLSSPYLNHGRRATAPALDASISHTPTILASGFIVSTTASSTDTLLVSSKSCLTHPNNQPNAMSLLAEPLADQDTLNLECQRHGFQLVAPDLGITNIAVSNSHAGEMYTDMVASPEPHSGALLSSPIDSFDFLTFQTISMAHDPRGDRHPECALGDPLHCKVAYDGVDDDTGLQVKSDSNDDGVGVMHANTAAATLPQLDQPMNGSNEEDGSVDDDASASPAASDFSDPTVCPHDADESLAMPAMESHSQVSTRGGVYADDFPVGQRQQAAHALTHPTDDSVMAAMNTVDVDNNTLGSNDMVMSLLPPAPLTINTNVDSPPSAISMTTRLTATSIAPDVEPALVMSPPSPVIIVDTMPPRCGSLGMSGSEPHVLAALPTVDAEVVDTAAAAATSAVTDLSNANTEMTGLSTSSCVPDTPPMSALPPLPPPGLEGSLPLDPDKYLPPLPPSLRQQLQDQQSMTSSPLFKPSECGVVWPDTVQSLHTGDMRRFVAASPLTEIHASRILDPPPRSPSLSPVSNAEMSSSRTPPSHKSAASPESRSDPSESSLSDFSDCDMDNRHRRHREAEDDGASGKHDASHVAFSTATQSVSTTPSASKRMSSTSRTQRNPKRTRKPSRSSSMLSSVSASMETGRARLVGGECMIDTMDQSSGHEDDGDDASVSVQPKRTAAQTTKKRRYKNAGYLGDYNDGSACSSSHMSQTSTPTIATTTSTMTIETPNPATTIASTAPGSRQQQKQKRVKSDRRSGVTDIEAKRARNRIAARRSRQRKTDRIAELEAINEGLRGEIDRMLYRLETFKQSGSM